MLAISIPNRGPRPLSWSSRLLAVLALGVAVLVFAGAAQATIPQDVVVISVKGDVKVTMRGTARPVHTGSVVELPAGIRTGADGAIALRQGPTTVAIAANTQIDIPASSGLDEPIDRVIQPTGSAFYDVGKRLGKKLRVETPYLVAVIKGTQFNVAVQGDGTTISLFEGQLEVRAPDDSDVVNINAGEIAIRHATDKTIRVLRMDKGAPPPTPGASDKSGNGTSGQARDPGANLAPGATTSDRPSDERNTTRPGAAAVPGLGELATTTPGMDAAANAPGVDATIRLSPRDAGGTDAGLSVQAGPAALAAMAEIGLDKGVSANLAIDAGANLGAAVGNVTADVAGSASVDLGAGSVAVGGSAAVDVGTVASVGTAVDAGVDLSAGTVSTSTVAQVAAGPVATDVSAGASLNLSQPAATVDTSITAGPVDASVGASLNVGTGTTSVDLGVAGVNVGVDLGLGTGVGVTTGSDTTTTAAPPPAPAPAPGLLDGLSGLLGKHR
ncbi:MAG TPA: FecR domain-containing protein [Steroidobacteraceae bacterium]|nr:FecR domain-containing protein [Steroidobacteraceae bacterium]